MNAADQSRDRMPFNQSDDVEKNMGKTYHLLCISQVIFQFASIQYCKEHIGIIIGEKQHSDT